MTNQLHPRWFQFEPGEQPTDLSLVDSLDFFTNHVRDVCATLMLAIDCEHSKMSEDLLRGSLWMLEQQAMEAKSLVENWSELKRTARQVAGGES